MSKGDAVKVLLIATLLAALAAATGGCGPTDAWTARRTATDATYGLATVAYVLIQAQVATGTVPDGMSAEEFAAQAAKADAGYAQVQVGYAACLGAIEAKDTAGYTAGMTQLGAGTAAVLSAKAAVCPVINKPKTGANKPATATGAEK